MGGGWKALRQVRGVCHGSSANRQRTASSSPRQSAAGARLPGPASAPVPAAHRPVLLHSGSSAAFASPGGAGLPLARGPPRPGRCGRPAFLRWRGTARRGAPPRAAAPHRAEPRGAAPRRPRRPVLSQGPGRSAKHKVHCPPRASASLRSLPPLRSEGWRQFGTSGAGNTRDGPSSARGPSGLKHSVTLRGHAPGRGRPAG